MKQIQEDQELKEIETRKSATAVQFVHPKIQAQRNKVRKSKHFKCSKFLALSSKMQALHSCQTNHIKHAKTMFQTIERCFPNQFLHIVHLWRQFTISLLINKNFCWKLFNGVVLTPVNISCLLLGLLSCLVSTPNNP